MKIFSLIRNEWIKLFSKKSTYVIIILIFLASAALPYLTYKSATRFYDNSWYIDNLSNEKQYLENSLAGENMKDGYYYYQLAYNKGSLEIVNLKLEANVTGYDDWRENQSYQLNTLYVERNLIEYYLKKDKVAIKELENNNQTYEIDQEAMNYYYRYYSTKKLQARADQLDSDITNYRNAITENDPTFINQLNVNLSNKQISSIETNICELNKSLRYADKAMKETINKQIADQQIALQKEKDLLIWASYRLDKQISLNVMDWKNRSISTITDAISRTYQKPMTKEEFDQMGGGDMAYKDSAVGQNMTYDEYLAEFEKGIAEAKDNIVLYTYSLENDIPPMNFAMSTRYYLNSIYFVITLVSMAMIFLMSPMISNEYSKGTMRLLLIRPVKRYKILFSKFFASLEIAVILLAISGAIYIGVTILLFGTTDFYYPILSIKDGAVASTTILQTILPILGKSAIVILFVMTLSFAFSTIVKSTVLAVGIPFAGIAFSTLVFQLLVRLKYFKFAQYSFIPYMTPWQVMTKTGVIGMLMDQYPQMQLNADYGIALLGGMSLALLILSFWVFGKRDVKN